MTFRGIFKEKTAEIDKNTEGVINQLRQFSTKLRAIIDEHSDKFDDILSYFQAKSVKNWQKY
jgi:hypothetical protein